MLARCLRLALLGALGAALARAELAIADFDQVFPGLTGAAVVAAVATPLAGLPQLPTVADLAPSTNVEFLSSTHRKMSVKEIKHRRAALEAYYQKNFASFVSLRNFDVWAQSLYEIYLESLGIHSAPRVAHLHNQDFASHRARILGLNVAYIVSQPGASLALSHFAILDPSESRFYTGYVPLTPEQRARRNLKQPESELWTEERARRVLASLPAIYDMRNVVNKVMPPIRDQQQCGACWAFSATSAMELQFMYANGVNDVGELSEGAVVECDPYDGGCNGGNVDSAWYWISNDAKGLATRAQYPYPNYYSSAVPTPSCNNSLLYPAVLSTDYSVIYLPSSSSASTANITEAAIMTQIMQGRPVVITIAASSACFQGYRSYSNYNTNPYSNGGLPSGFIPVMNCSCGTSLDHNVLAVGWTETAWILRNQWNTWWGVGGYAYVPRTGTTDMVLPDGGQCGMYYSNPVVIQTITEASPVPTQSPTHPTTSLPTMQPTSRPTHRPTASPTSKKPTASPTSKKPSVSPSRKPSRSPTTLKPTRTPTTSRPTSRSPSTSASPTTSQPTSRPTRLPSASPASSQPSASPLAAPTGSPNSLAPTSSPTRRPSASPSIPTTFTPSRSPTLPTAKPSASPASQPTHSPTLSPLSKRPTASPSAAPTTHKPSYSPSGSPTTRRPSSSPTTKRPTRSPSKSPTKSRPTLSPSRSPSRSPIRHPTKSPSSRPSSSPTAMPTSTSPTSSSPSSASPSTAVPSSFPTSNSPTSSAPSLLPTSNAPSHPTTLAPTKRPTSHAPVSHAPTTRAPSSHAPTTKAPSTHAPVTHSPSSHAPSSNSPTTHAPASHAPTTYTPTSRTPTSHSPTSHSPTSLSPTSRAPTTLRPSSSKPTTTLKPTASTG